MYWCNRHGKLTGYHLMQHRFYETPDTDFNGYTPDDDFAMRRILHRFNCCLQCHAEGKFRLVELLPYGAEVKLKQAIVIARLKKETRDAIAAWAATRG